jgi:hypothetical protein
MRECSSSSPRALHQGYAELTPEGRLRIIAGSGRRSASGPTTISERDGEAVNGTQEVVPRRRRGRLTSFSSDSAGTTRCRVRQTPSRRTRRSLTARTC